MRYAVAIGASLVMLAVAPTAVLAFPDTSWETVTVNGQTEVKGTTKIGGGANAVWFGCKTIPGSWSPSHWNAAKQLEMYVLVDVPAPPPAPPVNMFGGIPTDRLLGLEPPSGARETKVSNDDERVTLTTTSGLVTLSHDEFTPSDSRLPQPADPNRPYIDTSMMPKTFDPGYHDANIKVTGRIRDIVLNEATLFVDFGDPIKPAYSFASDLSAGRKLIMDYDANCK